MAVESFRTVFYLLNARYACNLVTICNTLYRNTLEFIEVCFCCIPRVGLR